MINWLDILSWANWQSVRNAFELLGVGSFFGSIGLLLINKLFSKKQDQVNLLNGKVNLKKGEFDVVAAYNKITEQLETKFNQEKVKLNEQFTAEKLGFENERKEYQKILMDERLENKKEANNFLDRIAEYQRENEQLREQIRKYEKLIDDLQKRILSLEEINAQHLKEEK